MKKILQIISFLSMSCVCMQAIPAVARTARPRGAPTVPQVQSGLQIVRALYGDLSLHGGVLDVTTTLQKSVQNNQLVFPAQTKSTWLTDPAPGKDKTLLIIFKLGNNVYMKLIADAAADTISAATAGSAMALIAIPGAVQPQAPARQTIPQPAAAVSMPPMLRAVGATTTPQTTTPRYTAPQQNQIGSITQHRLQQFGQ